jgi:nucleotide-binding universal stress UspA family protein
MKILLAVDGSKPSLDAVKLVIEHADWLREKPQIELITVHLPVPKLPRMGAAGIGKEQIEKYYRDEGGQRLAAAKKLLARSGLPYETHILVGPVAETLVRHAKRSGCDLICIGSHGRTALADALIGSTASKVLHISDVPVLLAK